MKVKKHKFLNNNLCYAIDITITVAYPGILFRGVQQILVRTEDRENGDLGAVAP